MSGGLPASTGGAGVGGLDATTTLGSRVLVGADLPNRAAGVSDWVVSVESANRGPASSMVRSGTWAATVPSEKTIVWAAVGAVSTFGTCHSSR